MSTNSIFDRQNPSLHRLDQPRQLVEIHKCPCCDGADLTTVWSRRYEESDPVCRLGLLDPGDEMRTDACQRCGFVFRNPRYAESMLDAYYATVCPANDPLWRPADSATNPVYPTRRLRRFETNFRRITRQVGPISSIVDVGGWAGEALVPFARQGATCYLADPGVTARALADDRIRPFDSLAALMAAGHKVEFAMSLHTMEHVTRPADFLAGIRSLLPVGGRAYVEVPFDLPIVLNPTDPAALHGEHINFFASAAVRALSGRCQFRVDRIDSMLTMQMYGGYAWSIGIHLTAVDAVTRPLPPADDVLAAVRREAASRCRWLSIKQWIAWRWYRLTGLSS